MSYIIHDIEYTCDNCGKKQHCGCLPDSTDLPEGWILAIARPHEGFYWYSGETCCTQCEKEWIEKRLRQYWQEQRDKVEVNHAR